MEELLELYKDKVIGSISGWDRIRFRGTVRWLASTRGLSSYLCSHGMLLKDFGNWANELTKQVRVSCALQAKLLGIPMIYLRSSKVDKEALAREIAEERGVDTGDICMFSVVEPCNAPSVKGNKSSKHLEIQMGPRKCVHTYHYWNHPQLGFGHTRLQSWLPFGVTMCINGRHWLERQLLDKKIAYRKDGNCFPHISDLTQAQELLDNQLRTNWPPLLNELLDRHCPEVGRVFGDEILDYYWSADETEWATDLMFTSSQDLDRLFPALLRYGLVSAQSPAVMRFFGKKAVRTDVVSDLRHRYEGLRIKHWINRNSIKMYNKAGSILRIETTITNTRDFKVFRRPNDNPASPPSWQKMRKGVSDLHRRAQVSQSCNNRYAQHLAAASITETLKQTASDICCRIKKKGCSYRALNPWAIEDYKMIQFIAQGQNHISGFRNKDLRKYLYPEIVEKTDRSQLRKASGRATRRIRLLRAHGIIQKVSRTNRYLLTAKGRKITNAILAASSADTQRLMEIAA